MNRPKRVIVVKIGGASLFSNEREFAALRDYIRFLKEDPENLWLLVVGGGETVESMRILHRHHPKLSSKRMHWRCVELLRSTNDAAAELLELPWRVESSLQLDQITLHRKPACYLVDVPSFYHPDELSWIPQNLLPAENWDTTSDTLAWLLALKVQADELQLIKKPDCAEIHTIQQAVSLGMIDPQVLTLSQNQPSHWKLEFNLLYHKGSGPRVGWSKKTLHRNPKEVQESL